MGEGIARQRNSHEKVKKESYGGVQGEGQVRRLRRKNVC